MKKGIKSDIEKIDEIIESWKLDDELMAYDYDEGIQNSRHSFFEGLTVGIILGVCVMAIITWAVFL